MIAPHRPEEEDYSAQLDLALWRKLFAYTRPYRRAVIGICAAGVVTAFADTAFPLLTRAVGRDQDLRAAGKDRFYRLDPQSADLEVGLRLLVGQGLFLGVVVGGAALSQQGLQIRRRRL